MSILNVLTGDVMSKKDTELEKILWEAFRSSGKPGYYMLFNAISEDGDDE